MNAVKILSATALAIVFAFATPAFAQLSPGGGGRGGGSQGAMGSAPLPMGGGAQTGGGFRSGGGNVFRSGSGGGFQSGSGRMGLPMGNPNFRAGGAALGGRHQALPMGSPNFPRASGAPLGGRHYAGNGYRHHGLHRRGHRFGPGFVIGSGLGYYGNSYYYEDYYGGDYAYGDEYEYADASAYCARRYRSYDPASGTYLGYDGLRHPCP